MISSEDVRHVTFDKAFQGYRREDVDDYLKQVAQAMDDLAAQNDDLQKKLVMLAQRIEKYRTMENSLSTSMINAQRMGDSIIRESKQKAAEIIRSANIKAEDREQRARDDIFHPHEGKRPREQRKVLFLGDAPRGEPEYQRQNERVPQPIAFFHHKLLTGWRTSARPFCAAARRGTDRSPPAPR